MYCCPFTCFCNMGINCNVQCNCKREPEQTKDDEKQRRRIYILLLGAAETGKSTMMRQMKIIHDGKMSTDVLSAYRNHIRNNVHTCVEKLIKAVKKSNDVWSSDEAERGADILTQNSLVPWVTEENSNIEYMSLIPHDHTLLIQSVWRDDAAQRCWSKANEYNLPDSTAYFLDNLNRIADESYIPTQDDVLRMRVPTKAVASYDFQSSGSIFQITDVGGQRGERRKWIKLFEGINAIIFLAALSEYDQSWSKEEEGVSNRLRLSMKLFKETVKTSGFSKSTFILFLNKRDVLEQKISSSNLEDYFPSYTGPKNNADAACKFIKSRFKSIIRIQGIKNQYIHETCATDTDSLYFIVQAVKDAILWANMEMFLNECSM